MTALTVDKYGSTTTLTASSTPVFAHQTVTFTAHVTPGGGNPLATGSVTFMDGAKPIGSIYLNASGTAVFSTALLATGSHSVTAVYSGNASLTPSTSAAVVVQILAKVATSTTIATSAAKIVAGASVTFTARVKPATGTVIPTGTVTFHDVNATIGTGTLDGTGSATFTTSTLAVGPHSISAAYGGDAGNLSSVSAAVKVNVTAK